MSHLDCVLWIITNLTRLNSAAEIGDALHVLRANSMPYQLRTAAGQPEDAELMALGMASAHLEQDHAVARSCAGMVAPPRQILFKHDIRVLPLRPRLGQCERFILYRVRDHNAI